MQPLGPLELDYGKKTSALNYLPLTLLVSNYLRRESAHLMSMSTSLLAQSFQIFFPGLLCSYRRDRGVPWTSLLSSQSRIYPTSDEPLPVSQVEPGPMAGGRDSLNWAFLSWTACHRSHCPGQQRSSMIVKFAADHITVLSV